MMRQCVSLVLLIGGLALAQEPELIKIEVVDPLIQERAEAKQQKEIRKEEMKLKNLPKTFVRDMKQMGTELKDMFGKTYEPGRLTGQPLSPRKHAKAAKELQKSGDLYGAACALLDALDLKQKKNYYKKAGAIAEQAYRHKQSLADGAIKAGKMDEGLTHYEHLGLFQNSLREHDLIRFEVVDVKRLVENARYDLAQHHYQTGETLFEQQVWLEALSEYKAAINLIPEFRDASKKISLAHYQIGLAHLNENAYEAAADSFLDAARAWKSEQIGSVCNALNYQLGAYYFEHGRYRTAYRRWQKLKTFDDNYQDIRERTAEAKEKATRVISFDEIELPDSGASTPKGGQNLGFAIRNAIRAKASSFVIVDNFHQAPDLVISGMVENVSVEDKKDMEKRKIMNSEVIDGADRVYKIRETKVTYEEHQLNRTLLHKTKLDIKPLSDGQTYRLEWDERWVRDYVWAVVLEKSEREFVGTGGELTFVADMVQEIRGTKHSYEHFQALSKKPPARAAKMISQMTKVLADRVATVILERIDHEPPLEPPTVLEFEQGLAESRSE